MPAISNKTCSKDPGGSNYNAGCDVAMFAGETLLSAWVIIYKDGFPAQGNITWLSHTGGNHYASSWAVPPMNTTPPYKASFRVQFSGEHNSTEIDVTG